MIDFRNHPFFFNSQTGIVHTFLQFFVICEEKVHEANDFRNFMTIEQVQWE